MHHRRAGIIDNNWHFCTLGKFELNFLRPGGSPCLQLSFSSVFVCWCWLGAGEIWGSLAGEDLPRETHWQRQSLRRGYAEQLFGFPWLCSLIASLFSNHFKSIPIQFHHWATIDRKAFPDWRELPPAERNPKRNSDADSWRGTRKTAGRKHGRVGRPIAGNGRRS